MWVYPNGGWPQPQPSVCPGCGRCNSCGRPYQVQPYWPVQPTFTPTQTPFVPTFTWGQASGDFTTVEFGVGTAFDNFTGEQFSG